MALRFNSSCVSFYRRVYSTNTLLFAASFLFTFSQIAIADTFTIDSAVTTQNGGNAINGNDTLTITTSGSITINGATATVTNGNNNTVTNNGTINVSGAGAFNGIDLDSNNDIGINNGSITITSTGDGIETNNGQTGQFAINNGVITTTGNNADGIRLQGTNTAINTGTIRTSGTGHGIHMSDNNGNATNSGNIFVTGAGTQGVRMVFANGGTLTNSGLISATGSATQAILGGANTQTVNIQTGSQIIGTIDLGANNDVFNVLGMPLGSSQMTLVGVETITLAAGLPGVVNGNSITTVDPTGQAAQGVALSSLTNAVHNVISQRMAQTKALPPIQLASLELSPGMLFQERAPIVWGEIFGSHRKRGTNGNELAHA